MACAARVDQTAVCVAPQGFAAIQPPTGSSFTMLAVGGQQWACGILASRDIACWGTSGLGIPSLIPGPFIQLAAGYYHIAAVFANGTLFCFISPSFVSGVSPCAALPATGGFVQTSAGYSHSKLFSVLHFL